MSREGAKLLHDELTRKLGPKGVVFSKKKKKEEAEIEDAASFEMGKPGAGVQEETNYLNAERQKKSISTFSDLYKSTISIPMRKDNEMFTNADLQVLISVFT